MNDQPIELTGLYFLLQMPMNDERFGVWHGQIAGRVRNSDLWLLGLSSWGDLGGDPYTHKLAGAGDIANADLYFSREDWLRACETMRDQLNQQLEEVETGIVVTN